MTWPGFVPRTSRIRGGLPNHKTTAAVFRYDPTKVRTRISCIPGVRPITTKPPLWFWKKLQGKCFTHARTRTHTPILGQKHVYSVPNAMENELSASSLLLPNVCRKKSLCQELSSLCLAGIHPTADHPPHCL